MENGKWTKEVVIEKIKKLKALMDRAGSPEEAANAMEKMNEIIIKYNVSLDEALKTKVTDKSIANKIFDLNEYQGRHDGNFARDLIFTICKFNFCKAVHSAYSSGNFKSIPYDQGEMRVFGSDLNLELVGYMIEYCRNQMLVMEKQNWKIYNGAEKRNTYRRGFYRGVVNAIMERLTYMQYQQEAQTTAIIKVSNALVTEAVNNFYGGRLGTVKSKNLISNEGRQHGYEAGKKLNLSKGLDGGNKPKGHLGS